MVLRAGKAQLTSQSRQRVCQIKCFVKRLKNQKGKIRNRRFYFSVVNMRFFQTTIETKEQNATGKNQACKTKTSNQKTLNHSFIIKWFNK